MSRCIELSQDNISYLINYENWRRSRISTFKSRKHTSHWSVEAHSRKEKSACFETVKMSSKVLLALATFTFSATSCLGYPGGFLDGLGGIATRQKCPPKPPTIKEFNATEVGDGNFIFITKKESGNELILFFWWFVRFPSDHWRLIPHRW